MDKNCWECWDKDNETVYVKPNMNIEAGLDSYREKEISISLKTSLA